MIRIVASFWVIGGLIFGILYACAEHNTEDKEINRQLDALRQQIMQNQQFEMQSKINNMQSRLTDERVRNAELDGQLKLELSRSKASQQPSYVILQIGIVLFLFAFLVSAMFVFVFYLKQNSNQNDVLISFPGSNKPLKLSSQTHDIIKLLEMTGSKGGN
jgi:Na+-translocating ferredoxin:NAD+ oxidoreductase RnfG subunit